MSVLLMSVFFLSVISFVECQEVHTCPSKNGTLSCSLPDTFCCGGDPDDQFCCPLWGKYVIELIIGACALVVLVVIICIICCCCCCKKRRRPPPVASPPTRNIELGKPVARTQSSSSMQNQQGFGNINTMQSQQGFGNNNMQNQQGFGNNNMQNQQGFGNGGSMQNLQGFGNGGSRQNLQGFGNSGMQNQPGFVNTGNTEMNINMQRHSSQQNMFQ